MPKADPTDNLLTRKLSASVTGERIFAGSKKTIKTDNSPVYLKKILSLSLVAMAAAQALAEPTGGQVVKRKSTRPALLAQPLPPSSKAHLRFPSIGKVSMLAIKSG